MAQATDAKHIDAPQEQTQKGDAPTQHIDRVELLKSDRPEGTQVGAKPANEGLGLRGNNSEGVLDLNKDDPLSKNSQARILNGGAESDDLTRGLKDKKGHPKEAAPDKPAAIGDGKPPAKPEEPVKILSDTSKLDPNKPTVVFLDEFKKDAGGLRNDPKDKSVVVTQTTNIPLNEVTTPVKDGVKKQTETGFTHGEFSARVAEEKGFNAIRAQIGDKDPQKVADFSKPLNAIADQVDSGKLKLGQGDVVNVSMGGFDPSFKQVNELLGSSKDNEITPQNIGNPETQKDLLDRIGKLSEDPSRDPVIREWGKSLVDTNKAIERLQNKGIEVLHSASNDNKDSVSLEFLKANRELASADPKTGKPDAFAPEHSKITPGNGVFPIRFQPGAEQGGGREGRYTVEGVNVKFSGEEFGNLNMQETVNIGGETARTAQDVTKAFDKNLGREEIPRKNENGYLVAVAAGNSFVNLDYLDKNKERLQELKRTRTPW